MLRSRGAYVARSREALGPDALDSAIASFARGNALIVVTQDLDFGLQLAAAARPNVIIVRPGNLEAKSFSEAVRLSVVVARGRSEPWLAVAKLTEGGVKMRVRDVEHGLLGDSERWLERE